MNYREIKTFDELWDIDNELYQETCRADLMHERHAIRCLQGYLIILGPDVPEYLEALYIKYENYDKWEDGEKDYLGRKFL